MKRNAVAGLIVVVAGFVFCSPSFALQVLSLEGNEYKVNIFPKDDAGSYLEENEMKKDNIEFNYGNGFVIQSFKDTVTIDEHVMEWLHNYFGEDESLGGTYDEDGALFDATYNTFDNSYNYYQFSIEEAANIFNFILFGTMSVKYYEPVWKSAILFEYIDRWELKNDAEATFIGIKN